MLGKLQGQATAIQQVTRALYSISAGLGSGSGFNVAQDEEIRDLFDETQRIDAALERIQLGVQRVDENSQGIQHQLDTQERMQRHMDKAAKNEAKMASMRWKLQRVIERLGKSRRITYAVLCAILIVLIGVIIFLGKPL